MRALSIAAAIALWMAPRVALACDEDAQLAEAALELASEGELSGEALERSLRASGSDLVHGWARRFTHEADAEAWLATLDADAPLQCGYARTSDWVLVVAAPRAGRLSLQGTVAEAQVVAPFREAHLVVRDGHDALHRLALERGRASLAELDPPLVVQLVATGPRGPRPVAERRLGVERPTRIEGSGSITDRLDALRDLRGVGPLRPNRLLAQAATRHAEAICAAGVAAHRLASSDPESRLASRGIAARVVGEAVARVRPGADPLQELVRSPGHEAALVDRRFTDVGVGEARRRGRRCVVVSLAAWPRYVGR